jgi:hypothetical protein
LVLDFLFFSGRDILPKFATNPSGKSDAFNSKDFSPNTVTMMDHGEFLRFLFNLEEMTYVFSVHLSVVASHRVYASQNASWEV